MKNLLITALLFFTILSTSYAQKCKPNSSSTDEFTEITTNFWGGSLTSQAYYSFNVKYYPYINLHKYEGNYYASISIKVMGKLSKDLLLNDHTWFEKGALFMLKLENELITLVSEQSVVRNSGSNTMLYMTCPISKEQIQKMASTKMLKGKIYPFKDSIDMFFQFNISKGRNKALSNQFNCFLTTEIN